MELSPVVSYPQIPELEKLTWRSPLARMQFSAVWKHDKAAFHSFLSEAPDFLLYSTFSGQAPYLVQRANCQLSKEQGWEKK